MRREVPIAITLITGLIMLLDNFTEGILETAASEISTWVIIVSALLVGLASVNLVRIHGNNISRKRPGWFNSVALLAMLFGYAFIGIMNRSYPENETWANLYQKLFDNVQSPLGAAMFAIIAFYIASASYRAFRARSLEATVLLLSAIVLMLGRAPIGELIWNKFPAIADWMMGIINTTGQRGITIGAAIGMFVTSLRVLIGLERGHLGGVE
ncbi:MAG: hypothetical protein ACOX2K_08585 [Bacillota bacterium]